MATLKERIRGDLTRAMKERDAVGVSTLRMALAAITNEEVAGDTARVLSDADVVSVLTREVRKRREASEAFDGAGRPELAAREQAEAAVLTGYLPAQLSDDELSELVAAAVATVAADTGAAPGPQQMGAVMKLVQPQIAGRADGSRVAAAVRSALSG
ncbi:GatB/YqeY domain-containing protein [Nakamurella endophytica]|uniref:GatB/YqeY domain-containing protein n=1 Tax=Nakamurella endophytica TaxID=1748367 RepID=A0A917SN14_9ACTN|nr:GatB/YqeY domain-containing protein [Nakamurella endophytica]GGL87795.1 hypothetical protein GCM10011594_04310 [Nakamurella endophytica]